MSSKRMVFLLIAVIVAGATAFMARAWLQSERAALMAQAGLHQRDVAPPAPQILQVLVARNAIHTGQIVKPDDLRWQSWPEGSLAHEFFAELARIEMPALPQPDFGVDIDEEDDDDPAPLSEGGRAPEPS